MINWSPRSLDHALKIACMHCGGHIECDFWLLSVGMNQYNHVRTATYKLYSGTSSSWAAGSFYGAEKMLLPPDPLTSHPLPSRLPECERRCDHNYLVLHTPSTGRGIMARKTFPHGSCHEPWSVRKTFPRRPRPQII